MHKSKKKWPFTTGFVLQGHKYRLFKQLHKQEKTVNGVHFISNETNLIPAVAHLYRRQQCHYSDQFSSDVVKC